jgi:hypothetical protein
MKRKLISIGYEIPGISNDCYEYSSDQSLLDADVVVFEPETYDKTYGGKVSLSESGSFQIQQDAEHWRRELSTALEDGKTIFLIFRSYQVVSIDSGRKEFKGARTINYVTDYNNYNFLPIKLPSMTAKSGSEIVFTGDPVFATFAKEFKKYLRFECYLNDKVARPLFVTKTGAKPIGAVFRVGKGHLVLFPLIEYDRDEFVEEHDEEASWTKEAMAFGNRLVETIFDIDRTLRSDSMETSPPAWAQDSEFALPHESVVLSAIEDIRKERQLLEDKERSLQAELKREQQVKNLLFETGRPLEAAVITALQTLGYFAENYDDGDLELDQVIVSPEGDRFIGECEGKDNAAVNIDKFRQLAENIQADLQRDEVENPAVGILFGNGFRLIQPKDRQEQFTQKCLSSAKRGTILVRTMDLYPIVRYIRGSNDEHYKKSCRDSILAGIGRIVEFPPLPSVQMPGAREGGSPDKFAPGESQLR